MSTISTTEPQFQAAVNAAVAALRRIIGYELEPGLAHRMDDLADRKEFLDPAQHAELLALVGFVQQRSVERLEARLALRRLHDSLPDLVDEA